MTSPILFCGQEDLSFTWIGGTPAAYANNAGLAIDDNSPNQRYRGNYSRYGLSVMSNAGVNVHLWRGLFTSTTSFWTTARFWWINNGSSVPSGQKWISWNDSGGITRLKVTNNGSNQLIFQKLDSVGSATTLGSAWSSAPVSGSSTPDKFDFYVNYTTSGNTFIAYMNGTQIFSYTGDITTNGVTSLNQVDLGMFNGNGQNPNTWSEVIVATTDTRSMSLVTLAGSGPGTTDSFTTSGTTSQNTQNGSLSGDSGFNASNIYYSKIYSGWTGLCTAVRCNIHYNYTGTLTMGLYADNGGVPGSLIGTGSATITNPPSGLQVVTLTTSVPLGKGIPYWVAAMNTGSGNTYIWNVYGTSYTAGYSQTGVALPVNAGTLSVVAGFWAQIDLTVENVSGIFTNDSSPDYSSTAAQIQAYQVEPSLPTGIYGIVSLVSHARAANGATGPQHLDFVVRTGGTYHTSPDQTLSSSFGLITYNWDTNPSSSLAWQPSDFTAGSSSFEIGIKSVT